MNLIDVRTLKPQVEKNNSHKTNVEGNWESKSRVVHKGRDYIISTTYNKGQTFASTIREYVHR